MHSKVNILRKTKIIIKIVMVSKREETNQIQKQDKHLNY